jgi:hypothetical protein
MDTRGWNDIAYSFLINHEGTIYEGRGPGIAGGHTQGHNTISHAICLLGNFDEDQPTVAAIRSTVELVRHGYAQGWWRAGFTGGHRDASGASTSCPGKNLYRQLEATNKAISELDVPPSEDDMATPQEIWLHPLPDMVTGQNLHASTLLRWARRSAFDAAVDARVARTVAEQLAQGNTLTPAQIAAIADAISVELADDVADEIAGRLVD